MKLVSLLAALIALPALAQDYPGKPIRMVVGFPPGGGTDVVARIITPRYSELLGQSVVIENRPGATGTLAAGQVAKSAPDGYTIMMGHVSVNAIAPALFSNLYYDVIKDFAPIGIAAAVPHFVTVHPSVPAQSLKELIEFLKSKPELTFPSAGNGSTPHLAGEIFGSLAGVKLVHVPYKGTGQSMQDLLGGLAQLLFHRAVQSLLFASLLLIGLVPAGFIELFPIEVPFIEFNRCMFRWSLQHCVNLLCDPHHSRTNN